MEENIAAEEMEIIEIVSSDDEESQESPSVDISFFERLRTEDPVVFDAVYSGTPGYPVPEAMQKNREATQSQAVIEAAETAQIPQAPEGVETNEAPEDVETNEAPTDDDSEGAPDDEEGNENLEEGDGDETPKEYEADAFESVDDGSSCSGDFQEPPYETRMAEAISAFRTVKQYVLNQRWNLVGFYDMFRAFTKIDTAIHYCYLKSRARNGWEIPTLQQQFEEALSYYLTSRPFGVVRQPFLMPINIRPPSIKPYIGKMVKVTVRWGQEYRGVVASADEQSNFQLENTDEFIGDDHIRHIGNAHIRFNDVYIVQDLTDD